MALHHHGDGQRGITNLFSIAAGSAILLYGLQRRDAWGAALSAAGGGLAYAGLPHRGHFRHSPAAVIPAREGIRVDETIVIDRPVALVYAFWRRFENLPSFMSHLVSVRTTGETTTHWVARGPARSRIEWDAELINDLENELLAWKSLPHADVENAGSVHFTPANDGAKTIVRVELKYNPPAGRLGAAVARLFGEEPSLQIRDDLQHFKKLIEASRFSEQELGILRRLTRPRWRTRNTQNESRIDEASKESFPASDSPSWHP